MSHTTPRFGRSEAVMTTIRLATDAIGRSTSIGEDPAAGVFAGDDDDLRAAIACDVTARYGEEGLLELVCAAVYWSASLMAAVAWSSGVDPATVARRFAVAAEAEHIVSMAAER